MAARAKNSDGTLQRRFAPAVDPEARENQLISLATDAAERELMKDSPDKRIVVHYLKLASTKYQLEKEKLRKENLMLEPYRRCAYILGRLTGVTKFEQVDQTIHRTKATSNFYGPLRIPQAWRSCR